MLEPLCALPDYRSSLSASTFEGGNLSFMVHSADVALQQIEEKGYAKPFVNDPRKIFKIGVSFSTANRRIDDWKVIE